MTSTDPPDGAIEQQLREMNDALLVSSVRQHEMAEQARKAHALMSCQKQALEMVAMGASLQEVLEFLARAAEEQSPPQALVAVHLLDESGARFTQTFAPSLPPSYSQTVNGMAVSSATGSCCAAVAGRRRVVIADIGASTEDPAFALFASPLGLRAAASTPIFSSSGKVLGTSVTYYREVHEPQAQEAMLDEMMALTAAVVIERKQTETHQELLNRELLHRTKNLLSVIQSLAKRSMTNGRSIDESQQVFTARLHALAHSTDELMDTNLEGASLRGLIGRLLSTFTDRFSIEGEHVALTPSATQSMALAVHELCTNAHKYGAFSTPAGQVTIRWSVEEDGDEPKLAFRWQERGGPRVVPPKHTSFGTTLLQLAIGGAGTPPHIDYAPEGLTYTFEVPLAAVAAITN